MRRPLKPLSSRAQRGICGDEFFKRLEALGLARVTSCRLTGNRRVMVSYKGTELRVHRGYVAAPDEVLLAIVQFVEARSRRARQQASRALLAFPIETPPARRRRDATHPADAELGAELRDWHARLNAERFGGELRAIDVRVSRRMRTRLGHYAAANKAGEPAEIVISRYHIKRHGLDEALSTLVHEMVHQWQDEQGMKLDHGPSFRAKARAVGVPPFARRLVAA
jgi:hypothetical protein